MSTSAFPTPSATAPTAPTGAFRAASLVALAIGVIGYGVGLFNATMEMNEKGYYLALLLFGLFAAAATQKAVRDKLEGIPVTGAFSAMCWVALACALLLFGVGLWNATLLPSEKGFYGMAYALALFATVVVQRNVRDAAPPATFGAAAVEPSLSRFDARTADQG
jgi:uncharacterized membrane protein YiaA